MPHIIIDSTNTDISWKWDENSILNHISKTDSPKDIFDAVCDEISRYYSDKDSFKNALRSETYLLSLEKIL